MKLIDDLIKSFNYAVVGIVEVLKEERNMKFHFGLGGLVLLTGLLFDISKVELLVLFMTITLVIFAEMINTAIEALGDLISQDFHPQLKMIKDVAAGAVLVTAINAFIIGYIIFFNDFRPLTLSLLQQVQQTPIHLTFISLAIVMLVVIITKAYFKSGTFLQGGMPSGHTAIAFCLVVIISILVNNALVISLVFLLAFLVAQSRIEGNIHSFWEVLLGGVVGFLVGLLIFQLLHL
ncbi:diacylglycerol kinase [Halanaerobaculum tunisiense]